MSCCLFVFVVWILNGSSRGSRCCWWLVVIFPCDSLDVVLAPVGVVVLGWVFAGVSNRHDGHESALCVMVTMVSKSVGHLFYFFLNFFEDVFGGFDDAHSK